MPAYDAVIKSRLRFGGMRVPRRGGDIACRRGMIARIAPANADRFGIAAS